MSSYKVILRTIVDLPDHQLEALEIWCEREGISRAEAIRRALDVALAGQRQRGREAQFGAWSGRRDGRALVDDLRAEWVR
jgi:metal-responsive CopG/Arc/MetJ family transcriptional regulator